MTRWGWVLGVLAVSAACGDNPPPRPRGLVDSQGRPIEGRPVQPVEPAEAPPAAEPPPPSRLPSPFRDPAPDPGALAAGAPGTGVPAPAPGAPQAAAQPERDLSAELVQLLGQPGTCLDLAAASKQGGKLKIQVTAAVVPSGRITRASVSVAGQAPAALKCLEQRVTAASLKGPIPDAPRDVRGELTLDVVAQQPPAAPAPKAPQAPPAPKLELAQPDGTELAKPDGTELAQPD